MLKKRILAVILGVSLMSSFMLWANTEVTAVHQLDVEQQLSISAHDAGEGHFITQVTPKQGVAAIVRDAEGNVTVPFMTGLGFLVFGLMYFVLRASRPRVK